MRTAIAETSMPNQHHLPITQHQGMFGMCHLASLPGGALIQRLVEVSMAIFAYVLVQ